jgi:hypothetical protein
MLGSSAKRTELLHGSSETDSDTRVGLTVSFRDVTSTPFRNKTFALAPRQRFHDVQFLEIGEMVDGGPPMPLMPGDGKRGNLVILEPELSLRSSRCDTVYPEERGSKYVI